MSVMVWPGRVLLLVTLCGLVDGSAAPIDSNLALKDLQRKYPPPFPSIYLTDSALNDLAVHLRDSRKVSQLVNEGISTDTLDAFKTFLWKVVKKGFLQVDLVNVKAGYKPRGDSTGVLILLPWLSDQVIQVAVLCDRYLQGQLWKNSVENQIKQGSISVSDAWGELAKLQSDPFVPTASLAETLRDYYALTEKNSIYLAALQKQEPEKFKEITAFRAEYEKPSVIVDWEFSPRISPWGTYTAPDGTIHFEDYPVGSATTTWTYDAKVIDSYMKSIGKSTDFANNPSSNLWTVQ